MKGVVEKHTLCLKNYNDDVDIGSIYGKPEGPNQQISQHKRYLCTEILCYIFSSYLTIIFLCNAFLGS